VTITLNIPDSARDLLLDAWGDQIDRAAFEGLVIEGYRAGKYGEAAVGQLLGHESRWDTERWLAERGVTRNYTLEDLEADRATLRKLFGKSA
jgi:hypothetical protein